MILYRKIITAYIETHKNDNKPVSFGEFVNSNYETLKVECMSSEQRKDLRRKFKSITRKYGISYDMQGVIWDKAKKETREDVADIKEDEGAKASVEYKQIMSTKKEILKSNKTLRKIDYHVQNNNNNQDETVFLKYRAKAISAAAEGGKMKDSYTLSLNYIVYYDLKLNIIRELGLSSIQDDIEARIDAKRNLNFSNASISLIAHEAVQLMLRGAHDEAEIFMLERLLDAKKTKDTQLQILLKLLLSFNNKVGESIDTTEETFVAQTLKPFFELYLDVIGGTEHHGSHDSSVLCNSWYKLKPDYLLKGLFENGLKVDVLVGEFKKPSAKPKQMLNDKVKLGNLLKLMVDRLVLLGVPAPIVCGLTHDGQIIRTYKMTMVKQGEYDFVELACFGSIRCLADLMSLPMIMSYFEQLAETVKQTLQKVEMKLSETMILGPLVLAPISVEWIRSSYEYPSCPSSSSRSKKQKL
ncbi:hypothetical protein CU098_013398 [Rhizopus stolonifer]|uniref:Uncharacterized protein n=1 Tax=Rhizopus stolonifer TaxID=4846 RepID=A0A367KUW1_RHIST|nr:hypothetical protein CU098_013398 [Rhizopus stolonifer]